MANPFDKFDAPNPFDQFDPTVNPSAESPAAQNPLLGIGKQAASGVIENVAGIPGTVPQGLKALGSWIGQRYGLPEAPPITNAPQQTPEEQLSAVLPRPQGGAEELARTYGAFPFAGLFEKGRIGQNIAGGIGAGAGSYLGSQYGPTFGLTPDQGSIGGAILGGYAGAHGEGLRENAVARQKMPQPQEVLNATSDSYDAIRDANRRTVLPPQEMSLIKNSALQLLRQRGPTEEDAKSVYGMFRALNSNDGGTVADLFQVRKNLHGEFHGGPNANKPAAIIGLDFIDKTLDVLEQKGVIKPGTMAELRKNDASWAGARTAQALDTKVTQAQTSAEDRNSGLGAGNKILQNLEAYVKSRTNPVTNQVYMNPADLKDIEDARKLSLGQKTGRYLETAAGAGGGLGPLIAGGVLGMGAQKANEAGYNVTEKGDPLITGIGIPALGVLGRLGFNRSIARAAKNAEASILARTPYAQGIGAVPPAHLLSAPNIAGRSLVFAAPSLRRELVPSDAQ